VVALAGIHPYPISHKAMCRFLFSSLFSSSSLATSTVVIAMVTWPLWTSRQMKARGLHLGTPRPGNYSPPAPDERAAADAQFDEGFYGGMRNFVDRYFHTKIAGAKFPNDDGSSRAAIVGWCKPLDLLVIQWDKGNRYDRYTRIVKRQSGEQLGFLPRGIAAEIHEDFFVPGVSWIGIFKRANHHPDTGQVVGAVILVARTTQEKRARDVLPNSVVAGSPARCIGTIDNLVKKPETQTNSYPGAHIIRGREKASILNSSQICDGCGHPARYFP
jgi:hypothetical protein